MRRIVSVFLLLGALVCAAEAQTTLSCITAGVPTLVRAEGVTERLGDIAITCNSSGAGTVTGNLTVFASVALTNRLNGMMVTGLRLTQEVGGQAPVVLATEASGAGGNAVAFNGLTLNVPAGAVVFRLSGLLGNASQVSPTAILPAITVRVSFNGVNLLSPNSEVTVGLPRPGLLATVNPQVVRGGVPLPSPLTVPSLLSGARVVSTIRLTEGFASSFTSGTERNRILVRFGGFPAGARIAVPNALAGSTATTPTSGGDLGLAATGGVYTPGAAGGSLLLIRVDGADANGAGGTLAAAVPGTATALASAFEVPLTNGAGVVVYEVVDENQTARESVHLPVFFGANVPCQAAQTTADISFAPLTTVFERSESAPIPRFVEREVASDCQAVGDCGADYFPRLEVDTELVRLRAASGGSFAQGFVRVRNAGGGAMSWMDTLTYVNGTGWIILAEGPGGYVVTAEPRTLAPGTYEATLKIDAGPLAGEKTVRVVFEVTQPAPPQIPPPVITSVVNAASWQEGPLQADSWATIRGERLNGVVTVTFDDLPAPVSFANDKQINVRVPAGLAGKASARVVVTVNNRPSAPVTVAIAAVAPAIFGFLNADWAPNTEQRPAGTGSIVQIFLTGLGGVAPADITVKIHDRENLTPVWSGPAPGLDSLQQVNVAVPADLPTMGTYVLVCARTGGGRVCSPGAQLFITRNE
ncbi:MAG: hypothetical protein SFV54_27300 [Bryobacteraceae bacterium]|nr:hypothetical protein [Bryobacteraceae bacterium]